MDYIIFEIIKLVLILAILVFCRCFLPLAKEMVGEIRYRQIEREVSKLVYAVQERYGDSKDGAARRAIVTEKIKEFLVMNNISLTDDQIRELNDAAVKTMKIAMETKPQS